MKNLEQIRAKNALAAAERGIGGGKNAGKAVAKKVPTMIMANGIIAAAAFANEVAAGYEDVFRAIITHLADENVKLLKQEISLKQFIKKLTDEVNSSELRHITTEAIAYLNYLRRFAK